jgi:hypothetical protein
MANLVAEFERQATTAIGLFEDIAGAAVSGVSAVSERVADLVPEFPTLPFAEIIPAPRDVVRSTFTVAERTLEAQRRVSEGFVDAIAPVTGRLMPWTAGRSGVRQHDSKPTSSTKGSQAA